MYNSLTYIPGIFELVFTQKTKKYVCVVSIVSSYINVSYDWLKTTCFIEATALKRKSEMENSRNQENRKLNLNEILKRTIEGKKT